MRSQYTKSPHARQTLENCENVDLVTLLQQLIEYTDELVRTDGATMAGTTDLATTVASAE